MQLFDTAQCDVTANDKAIILFSIHVFAENLNEETFVTHISVVDPDSGRNGDVNCTMSEPNFRLVSLSIDGQYKIVTTRRLDRELSAEYDLELTCRDFGRSPQHSTQIIKVQSL